MKNHYVFLASFVLGAVFLLTQCTDDETLNLKSGTLVLKITDAASDDENIKGIFITVADVKLDGKPIRNFNPQTIEISELQNGRTGLLIEKELAAKPYERISLVLASETDKQENAPGCYVLTMNDTKHNLFDDNENSGTIEVSASKAFELLPATELNLIIDFDLRKAIVHNTSEKNSYSFVTPSELEKAVRLVNEETSGAITGKLEAKDLLNTQFYVYAYRKGEFKASVEGTGNGQSKILFTNSVAGTRVEPDGSYYLPFIEEGEYDIRVASFKRNRDNEFTFFGFVRTTSKETGMFLNDITVSSGSETELNIKVYSLL